MCGIAGMLRPRGADVLRVHRMATVIRHRGPDDEGYVAVTGDSSLELAGPDTDVEWLRPGTPTLPDAVPPPADLVLASRRLAILDLSPRGHQPLGSGSDWIVHNGEIYNYLELRAELAARGHQFNGGSDTEVALAAYREWGTDCFARFNGMWGMAIWDAQRRTLVLSRDRFGVKPLYYETLDDGVVFASEIKALTATGSATTPNEQPLRRFLQTGRIDVSGDRTCFSTIKQVEPGTFVEWPLGGRSSTTRYYRLQPLDNASADTVAELLDDAVTLRLRSDVPVGSCLSGGLDSSALVALAQSHLDDAGARMHTFTFAAGGPLDESRHAASVARAVGAEPHVIGPQPDLVAQVESVAAEQDEPFGSGSVLAQRLVMSLAAEHGVTVLLDGQGGDEVFAGYRYYAGARLGEQLRSLRVRSWLRELRAQASTGAGSVRWLARASVAHARTPDALRKLQLEDVHEHLPALLHYEDRNSMAFSIETRLPFLDYRIVELGLGLSGDAKIAGGWTKLALRRAIEPRLPHEIVWRRDKVQFAAPQASWLEGPLRELARECLLPADDRPVADPVAARSLLERSGPLGEADADRLWRLLSLELWYRTHVDARPAVPVTAHR
jgi:asparagine synthase (glutamine-hydrolysing)